MLFKMNWIRTMRPEKLYSIGNTFGCNTFVFTNKLNVQGNYSRIPIRFPSEYLIHKTKKINALRTNF